MTLSSAVAEEQPEPLLEGFRPDGPWGDVHLTTLERCWFGLVDSSPVAAAKGLGMDFETTALNNTMNAQESIIHPHCLRIEA